MNKEINEIKKLEMCITSKCNLKCKHCYQHFDKNIFMLEVGKVFSIIDYVYSKKCQSIVLSGGECFVHPDIYNIIDYIIDKDIKLTIVTNGILIDTDKIRKYQGKEVIFQVSIDGNEELHDDRRGKGNYNKTIRVIRNLNKLGFKVRVNVTIDNDNYACIPEIINNDDFDSITFLPVASAGAAKLNNKSDEKQELKECIEVLYRNTSTNRDICDRCSLFPLGLSINYDGIVYPCSIARDFKLFPLGNINTEEINKIISDFLVSSDSDMFFEYRNNVQLKKCQNCSKNNECNQGCRMRAYKFYGNLFERDPFCCKIYRGDYKNIDYCDIYWGNNE